MANWRQCFEANLSCFFLEQHFFVFSELEKAMSGRDAAVQLLQLEVDQLKEENGHLKQESHNQVSRPETSRTLCLPPNLA